PDPRRSAGARVPEVHAGSDSNHPPPSRVVILAPGAETETRTKKNRGLRGLAKPRSTAGGPPRSRTGMGLPPRDFESRASTSSASRPRRVDPAVDRKGAWHSG